MKRDNLYVKTDDDRMRFDEPLERMHNMKSRGGTGHEREASRTSSRCDMAIEFLAKLCMALQRSVA